MRYAVGLASLLMWFPLCAQPLEDFWERVEALCDQAFAGELRQAPEGEDGLRGERLIMHVRDCRDDRIEIPFMVGEDRSRTWILTRDSGRLTLKHDHRHEDGSPDAITMYGGTSTNTGTPSQQFFPADQRTRSLIEPAHANVWTIAIEPGSRFTYGLWRLGTDRVYRVDFDLSRPVEAPPAPWGWEDEP